MHTHIMQYHYNIKNSEKTFPVGYRKILYKMFVEAFPDLTHLMEQNILRAVKNNKLLPDAILLNLISEVSNNNCDNVSPINNANLSRAIQLHNKSPQNGINPTSMVCWRQLTECSLNKNKKKLCGTF